MLGDSPLWRYTKLYDQYPKLNTVADRDNNLMYPVETSYEDSDTEKSTSVEEIFDIPPLHDISIIRKDCFMVTIAFTDQIDHEGIIFFNRSAAFHGISPIIIVGDKNLNEKQKIKLIFNKIKQIYSILSIPKQNFVVMVMLEAHKSFFSSDPYSIAQNYFVKGTLFSAQSPEDSGYSERWNLLNSNLFISNYHFIEDFFLDFFQQFPRLNFQDFSTLSYENHDKKIFVDKRCKKIFFFSENNIN